MTGGDWAPVLADNSGEPEAFPPIPKSSQNVDGTREVGREVTRID